MMYEAVAAGGKAALIMCAILPVSNDEGLTDRECMTDNPTRTVSRVKELLNKYGYVLLPRPPHLLLPLNSPSFLRSFSQCYSAWKVQDGI